MAMMPHLGEKVVRLPIGVYGFVAAHCSLDGEPGFVRVRWDGDLDPSIVRASALKQEFVDVNGRKELMWHLLDSLEEPIEDVEDHRPRRLWL